eukprot:jgi/Bigna1/144009/aug1.83_g18717
MFDYLVLIIPCSVCPLTESFLILSYQPLDHIAPGVEDNVLAASSTVANLADAPTDLNCKETSILIPNNSPQIQIHAPDGSLDYDLSKEDPVCNGTTFPMLCKFKLVPRA